MTTRRKRRLSPDNDENHNHINQPSLKRVRLTDSNTNSDNTNTSQNEAKEASNNTNIFNGQNPYSFTAKQLKELCRKKGLKVGGNKSQLIARLSNPNQLANMSSKSNTNKKKRISVKQVHKMLSNVGIEEPEKVNNCLKKGIQKQYFSLENKKDLDKIIYINKCLWCEKIIKVSLRDCLYQDDCGIDYGDGGDGGAIKCDGDGGKWYDECYGIYITGLCEGNPNFNSGKFHNHCTECPGFGKCIGDYRESHCSNCNKHWFEGNSGFPCANCNKKSEYGMMMGSFMHDFI